MASPLVTEAVPDDRGTRAVTLVGVGVAYLDCLESLIAEADDHAERAKRMLLAYREADSSLLHGFEPFGYDKAVHKPFIRAVLRYETLNFAFLSYAKNRDLADLQVRVRPVIEEARPKMAAELADYLTLLETTPREYMLAAVGMD